MNHDLNPEASRLEIASSLLFDVQYPQTLNSPNIGALIIINTIVGVPCYKYSAQNPILIIKALTS